MTSSAAYAPSRTGLRWLTPAIDPPAVVAWLLPFGLILLLAFSGGGYDAIVRGQTGIVIWWLVLVGAITGAVAIRGGRLAWAAAGLLALFTGWTALGLTWTESTERTVTEIARVATFLGVLVLALASQQRVAARHAVNGAACAIAVVAAAAVLSRLEPDVFGNQDLDTVFPGSARRLAFPLGYWNLLAGLAVIGVPLLLSCAGGARTTLGRSLACAALPVVGLCIFLTVSRGGVIALAVAVLVFLALAPDRLPQVGYALLGGGGAALLCLAVDGRDALQDNLRNEVARQQGQDLLGLVVLVCAGVGLLAAGLALADRHATRPRWTQPGRRLTALVATVAVVVAAAVFVGAGGPGELSDRIDQFKTPTVTNGASDESVVTRLGDITGNGRYQYWQAAERAQATDELKGIGPGTFEYWWARDGTIENGFVRDAHSLWFQTLAEAGLVGLVLIGGFFLVVLVGGAARTLRAADKEHRIALAGATAGVAGFAVTASIEWAWQMTVVPAAALGLAAVCLAGRAEDPLLPRRDAPAPGLRAPRGALAGRGLLAVMAVACIAAVGIPTAAASDLRDSQVRAGEGDLAGALERARSAQDVQPYSAGVRLQEALVLEQAGRLESALTDAVAASEDEPTNWRNWVVRSRLELRLGRTSEGVRSYGRARSLNPRSGLFR